MEQSKPKRYSSSQLTVSAKSALRGVMDEALRSIREEYDREQNKVVAQPHLFDQILGVERVAAQAGLSKDEKFVEAFERAIRHIGCEAYFEVKETAEAEKNPQETHAQDLVLVQLLDGVPQKAILCDSQEQAEQEYLKFTGTAWADCEDVAEEFHCTTILPLERPINQ